MTTQAQAIIERLQRLHSLIRYRVERVADARQPRTQELSLSLILTDLDAAINDIRGMLAEEPPFSYTDACFLSRVYNDAMRVPPNNWINEINEWLKYQIATRNPRGGDDAK